MRRKVIILLTAVCLLITGCTDNNNKSNSGTNKIDKVLNEKTSTESPSSSLETTGAVPSATNGVPTASDKKQLDYDLTKMGSDMVYATVNQMMYKPEEYTGKMIKISGTYYSTYSDETKQRYYAVIIADALGCCSQGIEFVWGDGSHVFPDEYPPDKTEVEVVGRFETYTEEGSDNVYCRLDDAEFKILQ